MSILSIALVILIFAVFGRAAYVIHNYDASLWSNVCLLEVLVEVSALLLWLKFGF